MKNTSKSKIYILTFFAFVLIVFFYIFNYVFASTIYYFSEGSMADSVEYLNGNQLIVDGIPVGGFFGIKAGGEDVFKVEPGGRTGFSVLNSDFSGGYINRWEVQSSTSSVTYTVRVSQNNQYYRIDRDGVEITGSPFRSLFDRVRFTTTGVGTYTIQETSLTCQETNVRGWARSEHGFWISFSCMNEYEVGEGVHYGVNIDEETMLLSGQTWSNEGWITFDIDHLRGCPGSDCRAILLEDGKLDGWGRTATGWVQLSGEVWILP